MTWCSCVQLVFSMLTWLFWYLRYLSHSKSSQSSHSKRNLRNHISYLKKINYQRIIKMLSKMQLTRTIMMTLKAMAITTRPKIISHNYQNNKKIRTHQRRPMLWSLLLNLIINNRSRIQNSNKSNKSMMVMTNTLRINMNSQLKMKKHKRLLKIRCSTSQSQYLTQLHKSC